MLEKKEEKKTLEMEVTSLHEIWERIATFLPLKEAIALSQTSKLMSEATRSRIWNVPVFKRSKRSKPPPIVTGQMRPNGDIISKEYEFIRPTLEEINQYEISS